MTDKHAETARLRCAHDQTMLALGILGLIAVVAVVGMLLGNDKAPTVLNAVIPLLAYVLGGRKWR